MRTRREKQGKWGKRLAKAFSLTGIAVLLLAGAGCGTTRITDTSRTATEQLLVSSSIDKSVAEIDCRLLANQAVFLDTQYLDGTTDKGYLISSLRQHLLANGARLMEDKTKAIYVVEARAGGIGTDRHDLLVGVPQMNLPGMVPGQPSMIPEIPFAKKTNQKGVAKIAVFAYNRQTGTPLWQSGVVQNQATSKDTWLFGAGPFRRGTLGENYDVGGVPVIIPGLAGKEEATVNGGNVVVPLTRAAAWQPRPVVPEPNALPKENLMPAMQVGTQNK